jgi:hypothetical protein
VRKAKLRAATAALFLFALACSLAGLDFGWHWDESWVLAPVADAVLGHSFLPGRYLRPSLCFDLALLGLIPAGLLSVARHGARDLVARLAAISAGPTFLLALRASFAALSCAGVFAVAALAQELIEGEWPAALAAALFALSWEFGYHSRWVAPDALMTALAAASMALAFRESKRASVRRWAAVAAGLACGAKYTAGLLMVPIAILGITERGGRRRGAAREVGALWLCFGAAYLLTTPGTVLEPAAFLRALADQRAAYGGVGELGYAYAVPAGAAHLRLILDYLARALFSRYADVSLVFFALVPLGAWALWRRDRRRAAAFLSFPVLYVAAFSLSSLMIVRNLLILLPFLAVLSAAGASEAYARAFAGKSYRWAWPALLAGLLAVEAAWLAAGAWSVHARRRLDYAADLADYVDSRPQTFFRLSPLAAARLAAYDGKTRANAGLDAAPGQTEAAFFVSEAKDEEMPADRPDDVVEWFGPADVDPLYYPTWRANNHALVVPIDVARRLSVFAPR